MMDASDTQTALRWTNVLHKITFAKGELCACTFDEWDMLERTDFTDTEVVEKPDFLATHSAMLEGQGDQLLVFRKRQDD